MLTQLRLYHSSISVVMFLLRERLYFCLGGCLGGRSELARASRTRHREGLLVPSIRCAVIVFRCSRIRRRRGLVVSRGVRQWIQHVQARSLDVDHGSLGR